MMRPGRARDVQRQKLYNAERDLFTFNLKCLPYEETELDGTRQAAQAFVDRVSRSALYRELAPRVHEAFHVSPGRYTPRLFIDPHYRGKKVSRAGNTYAQHRGRWRPELSITPRDMHLRWVLLHEAAHWCVPFGEAWHGPHFAYAYHRLVDRFIDESTGWSLYRSFERYGVESSASAVL